MFFAHCVTNAFRAIFREHLWNKNSRAKSKDERC